MKKNKKTKENRERATPAGLVALAVFSAGFSIMLLEVLAGRMMAPYFGNTIYTWTSTIGIVLLALSLGYHLGGRFADQNPHPAPLFRFLVFASFFVLLVPVLKETLLESLYTFFGMKSGLVFWGFVLFFAPSMLLSMTTPYAIRLLYETQENLGSLAGRLYMLGTVGSLAGTFLTGFVLIPMFGITSLLIVLGVLLFVLGILGVEKGRPAYALAFLALLLLCLYLTGFFTKNDDSEVLYRNENFYHTVRVEKNEERLFLRLDTTYEGGMYLNSRRLPFGYMELFEIAYMIRPGIRNALCIGAGSFSVPKKIEEYYPNNKIDVVDIDPELFSVARRFFRLDDYRNINFIAADARTHLESKKNRYDFIFNDAYSGVHNIPWQLTTKEFFTVAKSSLRKNGVYAMNIISALEGEKSVLFQSIHRTLGSVFGGVHVFPLQASVPDRQQNIILVAVNDENFNMEYYLEELEDFAQFYRPFSEADIDRGFVFRDDYAPVETIVAGTLLGER